MRALRVAADTIQLVLPDLEPARPTERWWSLPECTRSEVLTLLARLIVRGVLIEPDTTINGSDGRDE